MREAEEAREKLENQIAAVNDAHAVSQSKIERLECKLYRDRISC